MTRRSTFTDQSVTYGAIGATLDPDFLRYPPAGYRPAEDAVRLGSGSERFERAAESLMTWGIQRGAGFTVDRRLRGHRRAVPGHRLRRRRRAARRAARARTEVRYGADGTQFITAGMTATLHAQASVRHREDPGARRLRDRRARAHRIRLRHDGHGPETGEISFILEHRDDDTVWLTIRSILAAAGGVHLLTRPWLRKHRRELTRANCAPCTPRAACRRGIRPAARRAGARRRAAARIGRRRCASRAFGVYLHVPFCRVRCGYCDFNTYTSDELRGARQSDYAGHAISEVRMSRQRARGIGTARPAGADRVLRRRHARRCCRRPTSSAMLGAVRDEFGLADGAEVTTEANPDSVGPDDLGDSPTADSRGSRSACSRRCRTCSPRSTARTTPSACPLVVRWARDAGLDVSLDLIYGTPGESLDDWRRSLEQAIAQQPDHLSAYALIVEEGTKLARQIRRGELATPSDDLEADMYELADDLLGSGGLRVVRGQQLGDRCVAPIAPQPRLLARRRLVGRRPRRAQPRRRRALVEREAPVGVRRPGDGGSLARGRP